VVLFMSSNNNDTGYVVEDTNLEDLIDLN